MKVDMFDVLLYLFENYMSKNVSGVPSNSEDLTGILEDAGFRNQEIVKAFFWLEGLDELKAQKQALDNLCLSKIRIYNEEEHVRLGQMGISFILFLEQHGILTPLMRELILDRLLALDNFEIDLEQIKWVSLIVLYYISHDPKEIEFIEELVFIDNHSQTLH